MSTSLRSSSAGGPSHWAPTKTLPLDGQPDLQERAQEQLEKKRVENFWERLHSPSMDGLFCPLCMDQMVMCDISMRGSCLEGTQKWDEGDYRLDVSVCDKRLL